MASKGSWTVRCQECTHSWRRQGHWSYFEREAIESRPCPACGAYALASPEPKTQVIVDRPRRTVQKPLPRAS